MAAAASATSAAPSAESPERAAVRFQVELEFVQFLANPAYLHQLATLKYFEDPAFLGYLHYLQYWKRPAYARFLAFPQCLVFLDLLLEPSFRARLADPAFRDFLHREQGSAWRAGGATMGK